MLTPLRRLAVSAALLLPAAAGVACGGSPTLASVDAIAADHLEVVRGDQRVAETTLDHIRSLEATTFQEGERQAEGIPLAALLDDLKVDRAGLSAVEAIGSDGYKTRLSPELVADPNTLVVFAVDGEALAEHKGPLRLHTAERSTSVRNLRRLVLH